MSIRIDHEGKKKPLLCEAKKPETNYELHLSINEEKEFKERKKSNRAIKKLKKEGKVQSICGFLTIQEDKEDEWIQSKKENFVRNRSLRSCTRRVRKAVTKPPPPPTDSSDEEEDNDVYESEDADKFWNEMNDVLVQVNETLGEVENVVEQLKNDPRLNTADSAGRVTTPRADFPSSYFSDDSDEDIYMEDILSFRPFRSANNKPIKRS